MDPNKRGNPPFEPSSYAAGLQRRVERHVLWQQEAGNMACLLLDGTDDDKRVAEAWWREWLNQPKVIASE